MKMNDYERSIQFYTRSLRIKELTFPENPERYLNTMINITLAHHKLDN